MAPNPIDSTPPSGSEKSVKSDQAYAKPSQPRGYGHGGFNAKPMTFLGMYFTADEAKKLWNAIIQQINTQIKHDQDQALKAIRKLKKSETGQGGD